MDADGKKSVRKFASDMGCDLTCIDGCNAQVSFNGKCYENCNCGQGVISVTPAVNTAAIIESVYGNVHNLSPAQLEEIDWSLDQQQQMSM